MKRDIEKLPKEAQDFICSVADMLYIERQFTKEAAYNKAWKIYLSKMDPEPTGKKTR